jgi:hypothetical protein
MAIDAWMVAEYIMMFVQGLSLFFTTILKSIAINETIANKTTEDMINVFGFLHYFGDFVADHVYYVYNNTTTMKYSVQVWQKTAMNATALFGDWNGTKGLAFLWNVGYQCIQPGYYCYNRGVGNETTNTVLEFVKWLFSALGEVGRRYSLIYT